MLSSFLGRLLMLGQPKIKKVGELKMRRVAVGSYGSSGHLVAQQIAKHFGTNPETEISIIALGADGARLAALKGGCC
jgi:hypothetical protein